MDVGGGPDGVLSMLWAWKAIGNGTAGTTRVGTTDEGWEHSERSGQRTGGLEVKHEYGLLRDDQRTQRETISFEEKKASPLWEIAKAFKLEYGVRSRASAWLRLLTNRSPELRLTIGGLSPQGHFCRGTRQEFTDGAGTHIYGPTRAAFFC